MAPPHLVHTTKYNMHVAICTSKYHLRMYKNKINAHMRAYAYSDTKKLNYTTLTLQ